MIRFIGLLCSCLATGFVYFQIMESLYERKYINKKWIYIITFILYILLGIEVAWIGIPFLNLGYSLIALLSLTILLYNAYNKNILISSGITIIYLAIVDVLVTTAFSIFIRSSTYDTLREPKYFMLSGIGNAIAIICTSKLFIQILQCYQINKLSIFLDIYLIFLMLFELWVLSFIIEADTDRVHYNLPLLVVSFGFIVLDAGILYLYKSFSENALSEKRTELMERQLEMTVKYYEGLQENYEKTQKVLHDIKNHLQILNELKSKQNGIEFEISMQEVSLDFMSKTDITALFANLLDNAVEACLSSKKDNKIIMLRIHRFKSYIVIKLKNTIGNKPKIKNGCLLSSKIDHMGLGMSILGNLANKYCGNITYEYSDEFFETNIILLACYKT